jgi:hypothetical protein
LSAGPTTETAPHIEMVVAAKPKSSEPRENQPVENQAPGVVPQQTAAVQPKRVPQQEADVAPPLTSDTKNAVPIVPAESFVSRWGGLQ